MNSGLICNPLVIGSELYRRNSCYVAFESGPVFTNTFPRSNNPVTWRCQTQSVGYCPSYVCSLNTSAREEHRALGPPGRADPAIPESHHRRAFRLHRSLIYRRAGCPYPRAPAFRPILLMATSFIHSSTAGGRRCRIGIRAKRSGPRGRSAKWTPKAKEPPES
jgi:hypothetical protein